jgi:hypothetical protein
MSKTTPEPLVTFPPGVLGTDIDGEDFVRLEQSSECVRGQIRGSLTATSRRISACEFVIAMLNAARRSRGKCRSLKPTSFIDEPRLGRRIAAMTTFC